jgi:hypothetical protein
METSAKSKINVDEVWRGSGCGLWGPLGALMDWGWGTGLYFSSWQAFLALAKTIKGRKEASGGNAQRPHRRERKAKQKCILL